MVDKLQPVTGHRVEGKGTASPLEECACALVPEPKSPSLISKGKWLKKYIPRLQMLGCGLCVLMPRSLRTQSSPVP